MRRKIRANTTLTPATIILDGAGVQYTSHKYEHDARNDDYGAESSRALGVPPERIFKTLIIMNEKEYAVALVPVSDQASMKRIAQVLGSKKCQLTDTRIAEKLTGYVVGGISPLGQKTRQRTLMDQSALAWETVFVSGGRRGLSLELSPRDLIQLTNSVVAPITAS